MRATYPDNAPKMGLWVLVWLGLATRSNESAGVEDSGGPGGHGCGARGRWRGLVARNESPPLINPRGVAFVPGTAWPDMRGLQGLAAVPVGGGGAW